jgi:PAS domain S-box-containing protein
MHNDKLPPAASEAGLSTSSPTGASSDAQLRLLADLTTDLLWSTDAQGRVSWGNRRWHEYTGQAPAEAGTHDWLNAWHPDDQKRALQHVQASEAAGYAWHLEGRLRSAAGDYRWFGVHAQPVPEGKGQWLAAATDIQERKLAEVALHDSQARYQMLFQAMDQGFCVVEVLFDETQQPVDYRFLVTNPAFERATGLSQAVGQRMQELRPAHEAHWVALYGQIARTGEAQRFSSPARELGAFYEGYAFRLGEPAEHKVGILFRDISAAQRTEAALHTSEESYRALFNTIDEGYFLCEVLFNEQQVPVDILYQDANPAATRMVGADYRGQRLREIDPAYEGYWVEIFGRVAQTGVGERLERYAEPDQKWFDFYISKVGDEASRRVAVVFQDITERKHQEQALRASEARLAADLAGMRRLYELQAKLADQTDVRVAFQDVLALACEFTGTDRGCVQFLSSDGQRLEMFVWQGYPDDSPFINFFRYEGLEAGCEVARVQRKRLIIEDTVGFEGLEGTEAGAASSADGIRAAQSTPMTSRAEETIGVISTQFRQPHRPSDHELRLLDMLAWTAAEFLKRHRADAARRESEQQFRLMADAVPQIVWLTDAEGRMEFFNKHWSNYTGVADEPTTAAEAVANFVHPDDAAATMAAFTEVLVSGTAFLVEHRLRSQAGDYRWFLVRAEPYRKANTGEIIRWFGASVDIHERKQAEEALRASESRMQKAFSVDTVSQLYFSLAGGMTAANQAFVRMSGYRHEELLALNWKVLTAPEFWDVTFRHAGELAEQGETAPYEKQFVRPDGSRWWGLCAPTRLTGHGAATECMEFIIDISERKHAEEQLQALTASLEQLVGERTQELRENQELLQSVFDTSLISMSVLKAVRDEAGTLQDFHIIMANKELERETGRSDLVGKRYSQEYPGIKLTGLYNLMRGVLETGEPAGLEYYYAHEGFTKWYAAQFVKLDDGLVATNLDISERKLAEAKSQEQAHFIARVNETLPDLLTVTELASGQVLYVNRDPYDAPGFEREKLLHVPPQAQANLLRMHPDDAAKFTDYFARVAALADHEIATHCYRARFDTERWRSFQVRGSVFQRDPATGAATQVLSVAQDITARKEAELEQAKLYQLLRQSEEVASLGSWEYDRTTGEFRWSAGMYQLFGLPLGSPIRPATYLDFVVAEDRPVAERIVQGITTGRTGFEETLRIQVGDAVKTVRVKAAGAFDATGEPLRMLGVDFDISEVQRLEADNLHLRLTQQQVRIEAVLEAQEEERRRIAESLHNGLGQLLFATKLQFNQVEAAGQLATSPALVAAQREANRLLSEAIRQTRSLSHELTPGVVAEFGLAAALQDTCHSLNTPALRWQCLVFLDENHPLALPLQVAVYRLVQELTQNVAKHAQASQATLEVETLPGWVVLHLEDDGRGFEPNIPTTGIGLKTLRHRVALLGGTVHLKTAVGRGTRLQVRIPFVSLPA